MGKLMDWLLGSRTVSVSSGSVQPNAVQTASTLYNAGAVSQVRTSEFVGVTTEIMQAPPNGVSLQYDPSVLHGVMNGQPAPHIVLNGGVPNLLETNAPAPQGGGH